MSCIRIDVEKQIILRVNRLMRVRNVRCLRSDLLRVPLTRLVRIGVEMTCVRAPIVRRIFRDSTRLQKPFTLQKHLVLATPEGVRYDLSTAVINRAPESALLFLALNIGPHFIHFCCISTPDHHGYIAW